MLSLFQELTLSILKYTFGITASDANHHKCTNQLKVPLCRLATVNKTKINVINTEITVIIKENLVDDTKVAV